MMISFQFQATSFIFGQFVQISLCFGKVEFDELQIFLVENLAASFVEKTFSKLSTPVI